MSELGPDMRHLPILPPMPEMQCDAHCRECCCSIFPVSEVELELVHLYANERGIMPSAAPDMCPWYDIAVGRCAVHPARPIVCRVFGHVKEMVCPRGYNTNVDSGPVEAAARTKGAPVRYLHEVLEDDSWMNDVHPSTWNAVNEQRRRNGLTEFVRPLERTIP